MRKNGSIPDVSTESAEPQSFYGRWSRRKQQVREGQLPAPDPDALESAEAPSDNLPQENSPDPGEAPEVALLTDADMPPLESLDADSDYSGFLSEGVSDKLRNKALRKFFLSPQFNIVDGLDDYCEDFTNFEALGDIVTADMLYEREYEAQQALEREQELQELEQQQSAALESDADTNSDAKATVEDHTDEQPASIDADEEQTPPVTDEDQAPPVTSRQEDDCDATEGNVDGSFARREMNNDTDESLTAIPEPGDAPKSRSTT